MENKEKYYIPEIEEFCVGFECEMKNSSDPNLFDWEKCSFNSDFSNELSEDYCFEYIQGDLREGNIRVKHLDEQDILDLGFLLELKPTEQKVYFRDSDDRIGITFRKNFYKDFGSIHIYEIKKPILTFFRGKIKNKTEFKRVLKQIERHGLWELN